MHYRISWNSDVLLSHCVRPALLSWPPGLPGHLGCVQNSCCPRRLPASAAPVHDPPSWTSSLPSGRSERRKQLGEPFTWCCTLSDFRTTFFVKKHHCFLLRHLIVRSHLHYIMPISHTRQPRAPVLPHHTIHKFLHQLKAKLITLILFLSSVSVLFVLLEKDVFWQMWARFVLLN